MGDSGLTCYQCGSEIPREAFLENPDDPECPDCGLSTGDC